MKVRKKPTKFRLVTFPNGEYIDLLASFPSGEQAIVLTPKVASFGRQLLDDYHERVAAGYDAEKVIKNIGLDLLETLPLGAQFRFDLRGTAIPKVINRVRIITFPTGECSEIVTSLVGEDLKRFKEITKAVGEEYLAQYHEMIKSGLSHDFAMVVICDSIETALSGKQPMETRVMELDENRMH